MTWIPRKIYKLWRRRYRKRKYQEYLKSPHWDEVKRRQLAKHGKCQRCGSKKNLQRHHKRYYDDKGRSILGREKDSDLETLCDKCHWEFHQ